MTKAYPFRIKKKGARLTGHIAVSDDDVEWENPDVYYNHPLTGQSQESVKQAFQGWSEQDDKENQEWADLREAHKEDHEFIVRIADFAEEIEEGQCVTVDYKNKVPKTTSSKCK